MREQIQVANFILSERPDGTRCLSISAKARELDLELTPTAWTKLAEDGRWFHAHVSRVVGAEPEPRSLPAATAASVAPAAFANALRRVRALEAALRQRDEQIGEYFAADTLSEEADAAERRALRRGEDPEELERLARERVHAANSRKMVRERLLAPLVVEDAAESVEEDGAP